MSDSAVTPARGGRLRGFLADPLTSVIAALGVLPWLVQPGVIQPDTKIDLVVAPARYLARSLDAWSGHSGFGELQNQAYGYLFPMGAFFALADAVSLPGWAAQRAWWTLMLIVGASGAALFARRVLGVGTAAAALAGVLYALSPRVLSLLAQLSVETWPGMVMPWLLLAVHARRRPGGLSWQRYVGAVGVLCAVLGGVNATASLVAVLGAFVFALVVGGERLREDRRVGRRDLVGGLALGAFLGCTWWLGPLVVLGRYAYPFLDYIETSRITTAVTSVPGILRGASDWVAYIIDAEGHPVWQSGWVVAQGTASIVAGCLLAGVGLAGLLTARTGAGTHRPVVPQGLGAMVLVGVVGMGVAYVGAVHGPFASTARDLLDGPLAAARNVHKLDPLVRLPLVMGIAVVAERLLARLRDRGASVTDSVGGAALPTPAVRWGAAALAVAVLASMAPFWQGRLGHEPGVTAWPASLRAAAKDIDAAAARDGGSTLVLPSARAATYAWGTSSDEPLVAFAQSPVAVRASAPLVHPGAQRLMDAVDARVASGDTAGVAKALRRAGVARIVVRHGVTPAQQTTSAARYVTALQGSPDFTGHRVHGSGETRFDVFDIDASTSSEQGTKAISVLGGPESTLSLAAAGVLPSSPLVTGRGGGWITDDVRKRVYNNGRPPALAFGPTLTAGSTRDARLGSRDLDFEGRTAALTTLALDGVTSVASEGDASDPFGDVYLGPGTGPASALDASDATAWLTPAHEATPLVLRWARGTSGGTVTVHGTSTGMATLRGFEVVANGRAVEARAAGERAWNVTVPRGTTQLELRPKASSRDESSAVGISSIDSGGAGWLAVQALPGQVDTERNGVLLTRTQTFAEGKALRSEDDGQWTRRLTVARAGTMGVNLTLSDGGHRDAGNVLSVRQRDGSWKAASLNGSSGSLALPKGKVDLKLSPDVESLRLTPTGADARAALGLRDTGGSSTTPPATTHESSVVTLASTQGENAGWSCVGEGTSPLTLDGWRQGCAVSSTPSAAQVPELAFAPQMWHRGALLVGGLGVLIAAVLAGWPRRTRPAPENTQPDAAAMTTAAGGRTRLGAVAGCLVVGALAVALAGWWAVPALLLAFGLPSKWRPTAVVVALALTGPVMATLGVVDRASSGALVGQVLGVTALSVFAAELLGAPSGWRAVRRSGDSRPQGTT